MSEPRRVTVVLLDAEGDASQMPLSILILTFDEETNLPSCLESVAWCDDVVVLDSGSTDGTVDIAEAYGARVYQRSFDDFAGQRNWALDNVEFRHPWLFHLDADERLTDALRIECENVLVRDERSAYMVPSKMILRGRWLKWSGMYPSYQMRLMKIGEARFIQKGHGQREGEALRGVGVLREPYLHYNFSKGMGDWFEKHCRYAEQEAAEALRGFDGHRLDLRGLVSLDPVRRRRALKALSFRLPVRPLLRFTYMYFFRLGFLDGYPGFKYCKLMAWYEGMIVRNIRRVYQQKTGLRT